MAYQWRKDLNSPGSLLQTFAFGGIAFIAGLMGLFGTFGDGSATRAIGGVIATLGLLLQGMAIWRLRR